jgi:hypothetical protein
MDWHPPPRLNSNALSDRLDGNFQVFCFNALSLRFSFGMQDLHLKWEGFGGARQGHLGQSLGFINLGGAVAFGCQNGGSLFAFGGHIDCTISGDGSRSCNSTLTPQF